jgi:hypothetical protein
VDTLLLLASGLTHKNLWNPTILGVLVVISAFALFCGSAYLLLATNLGARLGFLVAAACLSGFMVLLSTLWLTTATPLNSPHGRLPGWVVKEKLASLDESRTEAVRTIEQHGKAVEKEELVNLRPAIDAALVRPSASGEEAPEPSPFAQYGTSTEFITGTAGLRAFDTGGGSKNVFWHHPAYAVVELCTAQKAPDVFDQDQPTDECDPLIGNQFVVLERDLGSMRLAPFVYLLASALLFALSLLGLHWYELDRRATRATSAAPATTA